MRVHWPVVRSRGVRVGHDALRSREVGAVAMTARRVTDPGRALQSRGCAPRVL